MRTPEPDNRRLAELFRELDFVSLIPRLERPPEGRHQYERDYVLVDSREKLEGMLRELRAAESFALDTETTSLFPLQGRIVGIAFAARPGRAFYVPFNLDPPLVPGGPTALLDALRALLTDPTLERYGQNTKYDWLVLRRNGVAIPPASFDTLVASFCASGTQRRHGLDSLALHYFGMHKIPTKELIGSGQRQIGMDQVPIKELAEYACEDADVTARLKEVLSRELEESGALGLFHDLEMPLVPVLGALEERGIQVDVALLERLGTEMEGELRRLTHEIQELAGENFNVNSTKVLGEILFEKLRIQDQARIRRPKRTRTGWATDADTLALRYGDVPIVAKLLDYREVQKLKGTYVDALPRYVDPRTGRIHCSYSQTSAATGRLASSDPNLQNIPVRSERGQKLREAFVPRADDERGRWVLLAADYSQIELRVMAHLSGDAEMRRAFLEGQDVHAATAMRIFDVPAHAITRQMRSQAKVINFGLLYGMGPQRLSRETGLSVPEARAFIERYFKSFPTVRAWMDRLLADARAKGYVETLLGRRRWMPEITSTDSRVRAFAENAAINTPVQGSAADVIKRAMIDVERALERSELAGRMLLQVHDELVFEVPERELEPTTELVRRCMEGAVELEVPLKVDFGHGRSWLEAH